MLMSSRLLWWVIAVLVLGGLFWPTFAGMVDIWSRSDTFAHGFLVLPISLYLIWRKRHGLGAIDFRADWRALPFIAVNGLIWLLARLIEVLVVEQLAAVVMIPLLVWLVFGFATLRYLSFPLLFLLFAAPMGEGLVYPLMQFTASFTVFMLRLTGIPVYWEGTFISIPSGDWSVVAACSGIRYLIASLFLGVLYAYLNYRSLWRRLAFVAVSALVPILANGLRAYLIVLMGHLSDMRLATGVDHLIYGWVFFGLVMFILFAIGNIWSERTHDDPLKAACTPSGTLRLGRASPAEQGCILLGLTLLAGWPLFGIHIQSRAALDTHVPAFEMPMGSADWQAAGQDLTQWSPRYLGMTSAVRRDFVRLEDSVGVYLALYGPSSGEMVNSENLLVSPNSGWRLLDQSARTVSKLDNGLEVIEARLDSTTQDLLIWSWYWVSGYQTSNAYVAKIHEALSLLLGRRRNEASILIYTPIDLKVEPARQRLEKFAEEMMPSLDSSLRKQSIKE